MMTINGRRVMSSLLLEAETRSKKFRCASPRSPGNGQPGHPARTPLWLPHASIMIRCRASTD